MPDVDSRSRDSVHAIIDGGEEGIEILLEAMTRCLDTLPPHQVLEVSSAHPDALAQLPRWCEMSGHTLQRLVWVHGAAHYWIEKGPAVRGQS